jgi:preprotein translocase subunit SecE
VETTSAELLGSTAEVAGSHRVGRGGVVGNSYFSNESCCIACWHRGHCCGCGFCGFADCKGRDVLEPGQGSRTEIRKVVWPTRQETVQTTMIVVAFVLLVALILWGLDSFLGWLVSLVIG